MMLSYISIIPKCHSRCCHIRIACIVIMTLELIDVAYTFFNAYRYLDGSSTKALVAVEALGIVSAVVTLVAAVFGFLAIYYV